MPDEPPEAAICTDDPMDEQRTPRQPEASTAVPPGAPGVPSAAGGVPPNQFVGPQIAIQQKPATPLETLLAVVLRDSLNVPTGSLHPQVAK